MDNPQIYALLVGIDRYQPPVPALAGCVNDMLAFKQFIQNRTEPSKLHMSVLMDEEATRINIVEKFETHLTQAGPNDVALFYYSGHGSQEQAHEVFWDIEPDRMNETLVCYDSRMHDGMDLADKELATLIEMVAKNGAHMLVVMDCCNSGSGTRGEDDEFWPRQTPASTMVRSLDSYILPRNISHDRSAFVAENQQITIPSGRHVALSAAQPFQLAKETQLGGRRRGVFTYSLLEVLQDLPGTYTYDDIIRRVRTLVTQRTFDQSPQLYAQQEEDINLAFLGGAVKARGAYFMLMFDPNKGWQIDGGQVHGLKEAESQAEPVRLAIYSDGTAFEDMKQANALGEITVKKVDVTDSTVQIPSGMILDKGSAYRAKVVSMPIAPFKVCIKGDHAEGIRLAEEAMEMTEYSFYLQKVNRSGKSDLNLYAMNQLPDASGRSQGNPAGFMINRPSDRQDQPLVEQLIGITPSHAKQAVEFINHIARWNRVLELNNPSTQIAPGAVRIELYPPMEDQALDPGKNGFILDYTKNTPIEGLPKFRLKIVNTSHRRLYCSLLYLSSRFAVMTRLFGDGGVWLDSGGEAWAIDGKAFTAKIADEILAFGSNEVQEIFKLFVSEAEFNLSSLQQKALDLPKVQLRDKPEMSTRSLLFVEPTQTASTDWTTSELSITIRQRPEA